MSTVRPSLEARLDSWTVTHPHAPVLRQMLRIPMVLWRLGLGPVIARIDVRRGHLVVLTTTGRSSGVPRHVPVVVHEFDGRSYLWCPYGGRSQWYRNVLADPIVTVQGQRGARTMRAVAVDVVEAIDFIAELRRFDETFLRSYLAAEDIPDTSEDMVSNARRLHIRRLEPTPEDGPTALEPDLVRLWTGLAMVSAIGMLLRFRRPRRPNRAARS